jgi:hypothetical protein
MTDANIARKTTRKGKISFFTKLEFLNDFDVDQESAELAA